MSGLRILMVEDEALVALDIQNLLTDAGCDVVACLSELDGALAWLEARREPLDGAVLDVNLGGRMVFPLADALKARGVPFVFATGYGSMQELVRYEGAVVLAKPVAEAELRSAVRRFRRAA
jgi:CheY-like chemotaxis protein